MEFTIYYRAVSFSGMERYGEITMVAESKNDIEENGLKSLMSVFSEDGRDECLKSLEITRIVEVERVEK